MTSSKFLTSRSVMRIWSRNRHKPQKLSWSISGFPRIPP